MSKQICLDIKDFYHVKWIVETAKMLLDAGNHFYNDQTREAVCISKTLYTGHSFGGRLFKEYMPKIEAEMNERDALLTRASDLLQKVSDILNAAKDEDCVGNRLPEVKSYLPTTICYDQTLEKIDTIRDAGDGKV